MKSVLLILSMLVVAFSVQAGSNRHAHTSKYAGQEAWAIKGISPEDISELRRGGGWGLAKAAELNGVPGPAHLLELKDDIPLTAAQAAQITAIYEDMKSKAIEEGEKLILLEQALELHFQNGTITDTVLRSSLDATSESRRNLRYIHLATHLKMPEILSKSQIRKYNDLRGYSKP